MTVWLDELDIRKAEHEWHDWLGDSQCNLAAGGKKRALGDKRFQRGMEQWMAFGTHLDSWDALGQYDMHVFEVENHFDVPIGGK